MAYFNHAFRKVFLGTGEDSVDLPFSVSADGGYIIDPDIPTSDLSLPTVPAPSSASYTGGYFGVFDSKTYLSMGVTPPANLCCPFIIASSPLMTNDKIGPFAGGYRESNKSKIINPKYVRQFYYVEPCTPQQSVVSIGYTPGTLEGEATPCAALDADLLNPNNFLGGTTCNRCEFSFLCGETYYMRIDVKGSPALRFLNHQAYQTLDAYTGCCDPANPAPVAVDPTLVYISWASKIVENPYIKDLIMPVVYDTTGLAWYAPGTTLSPLGVAVTSVEWWDAYTSPAGPYEALNAGMRLFGAYVETKFGNCTFQVTDFFEKEPVKIIASMVDYTGDPCTFEGVCVYTDCYGVQGMGFGEQVLRDLILSESYLQNYVGSGQDMRIREITQGYDIINAVNRSTLYGRYFLLHSVPRFNNPTGVFDNDQYLLEIITSVTVANPTGQIGEFETLMLAIFNGCPGCIPIKQDEGAVIPEGCTPCVVAPDAPVS